MPFLPRYVCATTDFDVYAMGFNDDDAAGCQHPYKLSTAKSQEPLRKIVGLSGPSIRGVKVVVAQGWDFARRRSMRRT